MRGRKEELGAETSERGGSGGPGCAGRDWRLCIAIGLPSDSESRRLMNSASPSTSWSELSRGKPWPWPHHRRQALTAHACDRSTRGTEHKTRSSRPSLPRFSWFWDQSEVYETAPQKKQPKTNKRAINSPNFKEMRMLFKNVKNRLTYLFVVSCVKKQTI